MNQRNVSPLSNPFVCTQCGDRFPAYRPLIEHAKIHQIKEEEEEEDASNSIECMECGSHLPSYSSLVEHAKVHQLEAEREMKNSFVCVECDDRFASYKSLIEHKKVHQIKDGEATVLQEQIRMKVMQQVNQAKNRQPVHHVKKLAKKRQGSGYKAGVKSRVSKPISQRQLKARAGKSEYKCVICNLFFKRLDHFSRHLKEQVCIKSKAKGRNKCNLCGKCFISKDRLRQHMKDHSDDRHYECESCKSCFKRSDHLSRHLKNQVCLKTELESNEGSNPMEDCMPKQEKENLEDNIKNDHNAAINNPIIEEISPLVTISVNHLVSDKVPDVKGNKCSACGKSFATRQGAKRHLKEVHTHSNVRKFKCDRCDLRFKRRNDLDRHVMRQSCKPETRFQEESSNLVTQQMEVKAEPLDIRPDSITAEVENGKVVNQYKDQIEGNGLELIPHKDQEKHKEKSAISKPDPACLDVVGGRRLSKRIAMKEEEKSVKPHDSTDSGILLEQKNECDNCGKSFIGKDHLDGHLMRQECMQNSTRVILKKHRYKCVHCSLTFHYAVDLVKHSKSEHCDTKPFACSVCGVKFAAGDTLNRHIQQKHPDLENNEPMLQHDNEKRKIVEDQGEYRTLRTCGKCKKSFANRSDLHRHMAEEHYDSLPHKCEICFKRFLFANKLKRHSSVHSDAKSYQCKDCNKRYKYKDDLRDHMRCHSDKMVKQTRVPAISKKPKSCVKCKKKFSFRVDLLIHMKKEHNDFRPHVCEICARGFALPGHLKRHRSVHSDVRPFACHICNNKYKYKDDLAKHIKRHASLLIEKA